MNRWCLFQLCLMLINLSIHIVREDNMSMILAFISAIAATLFFENKK